MDIISRVVMFFADPEGLNFMYFPYRPEMKKLFKTPI